MESALQEMVVSARSFSGDDIKSTSTELAEISSQIERGLVLRGRLLPIEKSARTGINQKLTVLEKKRTELEHHLKFGENYQLLNLEPLTWRNKSGLPKLCIFSLGLPTFRIAATKKSWSTTPKLPEALAHAYDDVIVKLQDTAKEDEELWIEASFEGVIPSEVKDKIAFAHKKFKKIFLIAEPKGFAVGKRALVIPKRDPLVVGWDGSQLWLIAAFDTTPVEEAMMAMPSALPSKSKNKK